MFFMVASLAWGHHNVAHMVAPATLKDIGNNNLYQNTTEHNKPEPEPCAYFSKDVQQGWF